MVWCFAIYIVKYDLYYLIDNRNVYLHYIKEYKVILNVIYFVLGWFRLYMVMVDGNDSFFTNLKFLLGLDINGYYKVISIINQLTTN
jgi:hypothetical protein